MTDDQPARFPRAAGLVLVLLVVAVWLVLCTQPDQDGDLWFHLAYGKQMIAGRTPFVDHGAFTWTPGSNARIYCAWIAQVGFQLIHQVAGLPGLFVLRYACVAALVILVLVLARMHGVAGHGVVWFIALTSLLMTVAAAVLKPQLLSFFFMTLAVFAWILRRDVGKRRISAAPSSRHGWPSSA